MRLNVRRNDWSCSPFMDWVASLGDDEDQINGYGRTAVDALEDLKGVVADEEVFVDAIDRKIRAHQRMVSAMYAQKRG